MSQEIVFTSARRGLRSGSTGFCTVRSTRGMPSNLAQMLERLTGYTHTFDAYSDEASLNPVNFAHYTARLGDQRFHILARISNAPLDHTNRSNKLAHVLAIDGSHFAKELSEGPASESMTLPWIRAWSSDTEPYVLPDQKQIQLPTSGQSRVENCIAWNDATCDPGWAAVLAESGGDGKEIMTVIVPRDVGRRDEFWSLQLVNEALSLLPPMNRWDVTYSTVFSGNLPVSISCQWQFVLDGTDQAKRARLNPRVKTIDIPDIVAQRLKAPKSPLTALTTIADRPWYRQRSTSKTAQRPTRVATSPSVSEDADDDLTGSDPLPTVVEANHAAEWTSTDWKGSGPIKSNAATQRHAASGSKTNNVPLLLRPVSLIIGAAVVLLVGFMLQRQTQNDSGTLQEIVKSAQEHNHKDEAKKQKRQADEQNHAEAAALQREQEQQRLQAQAAGSPEHVAPTVSENSTEHVPVEEMKPETPRQSPLQDVWNHANRLELKLPQSGLSATKNGPMHLAKIFVTSPEQFNLVRIIGGRTVLKSGLDFLLKPSDSQDYSIRQWDVTRNSISGVGLGGPPDRVGTFQLNEKSELTFHWDTSNDSFELINCLLEMEVAELGAKPEQEECTLREVVKIPPLKFNLNEAETVVPLLNRNQLANTHAVELVDCDFRNLPGNVTRTGSTQLHVGDSVTFQIQEASSGIFPRNAAVSVSLVESDQSVQIRISMELKLPAIGEIASAAYAPGLMKKTANNIKDFEDGIEKDRRILKAQQKNLNDQEAAFKLVAPKERSQDMKDALDAQRTLIKNLDVRIHKNAESLRELNSLAGDVNQMLESISNDGELHFRLRLMIPDAGDQGIRLVETKNE